MSALVIEHVKVSELPEPWRAQLAAAGNTRVTVRIEEEAGEEEHVESAFGMWATGSTWPTWQVCASDPRAPLLPRVSAGVLVDTPRNQGGCLIPDCILASPTHREDDCIANAMHGGNP